MTYDPRTAGRTCHARRGMVLVVVLVVVALLALAAYTFAALMATHLGAAKLGGRQLQCRALVESGVEAVRLYLMLDEAARSDAGGEFNNPSYFQAMPVLVHDDATQRADFTVLVPNLDDQGNLGGVRYGLEDESTRLHLNALLTADKVLDNAGRDLLMGLPGMTVDVADAILDWMDDDDEPREYGAESSYYQGLKPPYAAKNGLLDTVEELLLVRGVTPQLLFGTDTNRNGMVDPHESNLLPASGTTGQTLPSRGTDPTIGSMDRGWSGYLTLYSAEKNVSSAGTPRIDVNQDDLAALYDSLATALNEDWAKFIVLYRQHGAYDGDEAGEDVATITDIDLTQEGGTKLTQVLDLIGAKVQIPGSGDGEGRVVAAAFPETLAEMMVYMPILMDHVAVNAQPTIPGRINVNLAPRTILQAIPGLEETVVEEIVNQRAYEAETDAEALARRHETWLLTAGIVTLDEMKQLVPFICAGGDVYRAQVVGYYEDGGAAARAEVIFDATGAVPRVVSWREISHLGRGYPLDLLGVQFQPGS
ncbi:MAG: general secretion pathway protein GspK [Pirellulaceae bacterium]|nr:general secretion pathway protein GspK [Pirellulaceae bacterium]